MSGKHHRVALLKLAVTLPSATLHFSAEPAQFTEVHSCVCYHISLSLSLTHTLIVSLLIVLVGKRYKGTHSC